MIRQISINQYPKLLPLFSETPENVYIRSFLERNLCEVYISGDISHPQAIVVRSKFDPQELFGYGNSQALYDLLQTLNDWSCVLVNNDLSIQLGNLFISKGVSVKYYKDIYYTIQVPVLPVRIDNVRLLSISDTNLILNAPKQLQGAGFANPQEMLIQGVVAGAIVDNQLVAIAHTSAISNKFSDVGVYTAQDHRGKGYSTAAATLVIEKLQARNLIPVWSTGEDNLASQKVAQKIGFTKTSTKTYIILKDQSK